METNNRDDMLIYQSKDGKNEDRCTFRRRNSVAVLGSNVQTFCRDRSVITKHIRNIFEEEELDENSKVQKMHIANSDKPVKL